jgi:mandelamide amidase
MPLTINKFDQVGPVARSVADLLLFDRAVAGDREPIAGTPLTGGRIGLSPYFWSSLDPEVARVSNEALQKLSDSGATLVWSETPEFAKAMGIALTIIAYDTLPSISDFLRDQGADVTVEQMLEQVGGGLQAVMFEILLTKVRPTAIDWIIITVIVGSRLSCGDGLRPTLNRKIK